MNEMKAAVAVILLLAAIGFGCTSNRTQAGTPLCEGYFSSFYINSTSVSLDSINSNAKSAGFTLLFSDLSEKTFAQTPISCFGARDTAFPLKEGDFSCQYREGGFDYEKDYKSAKVSKNENGASYSFTIYERCDKTLKIYFEYKGGCTAPQEVRETAAAMLLQLGFSNPPESFALIKNI